MSGYGYMRAKMTARQSVRSWTEARHSRAGLNPLSVHECAAQKASVGARRALYTPAKPQADEVAFRRLTRSGNRTSV